MAITLARQQQLRGTAADWAARSTFIALAGEHMSEIDTGRIKVGDGSTPFSGLPYVGNIAAYATQAEVENGAINDQPVAPDTLKTVYPQKLASSPPQSIESPYTFTNTVGLGGRSTVALSPRTNASGIRDIVGRADLDAKFANTTSTGASDAGKAPILNSSGQLDGSFFDPLTVPSYRGGFDPVTGAPPLQNGVANGGVASGVQNGDNFIATRAGLYDFGAGLPGAGTQVLQNDNIVWDAVNQLWDIFNQGTSVRDPGAVQRTPTSTAESTIKLPAIGAYPTLRLEATAGQSTNLLEMVDESGNVFGAFDQQGRGNGLTIQNGQLTGVTIAPNPIGYGDKSARVANTLFVTRSGPLLTVVSSGKSYAVAAGAFHDLLNPSLFSAGEIVRNAMGSQWGTADNFFTTPAAGLLTIEARITTDAIPGAVSGGVCGVLLISGVTLDGGVARSADKTWLVGADAGSSTVSALSLEKYTLNYYCGANVQVAPQIAWAAYGVTGLGNMTITGLEFTLSYTIAGSWT